MGINDKAWGGGFKRLIGDESLGATLGIATDTDTKQVHVCDIADAGTDWALSASSHPDLYIHSATTPATNYIRMYHDGTTGNINPGGAAGKLAISATWTTAGTTGRPFAVNLTTNVQLGSYANALKGNVDLSTNGGTTGLLSAVIGEITMATSGDSGNYACFEGEMTYGATSGSLPKPLFMYFNTSGTANGDFDTYGSLLRIGEGITAGAGLFLSADTQTLRVSTGSLGATKKYLVMSDTENILSLNVATLAANGRIAKFAGTVATPANPDGQGFVEIDLTVTGTATGGISATSTWINLGTSAVSTDYIQIHNDGIWDGTATLTSALVSMHKYQCLLASNPQWLSVFELNFQQDANNEIDALFNVNDASRALGFEVASPTGAATGSIPFFSQAGGGAVKWIRVYDDATT